MRKNGVIVAVAFLVTLAILAFGYLALGFLAMMLFTLGFLWGFVLWVLVPSQPPWRTIRWPFWIAFVLFIVHRVEEKVTGFFDVLAKISGQSKPKIESPEVIMLVIFSVAGWVAIPFLVRRRLQFGYYLCWTFFMSMGVTELAHVLVFPFMAPEYSYFPGMYSVFALAPVAWWGLWKLARNRPADFYR